jgi:thioredoxin 1
MNKSTKSLIVAFLCLAVAGAVLLRSGSKDARSAGSSLTNVVNAKAADLPRLVDFGSVTCIPCKLMAPILEELKKDLDGRLIVEFVDVRLSPETANASKIKLIPTQVFFDASGKELFRHEGYFGREEILAKWKDLGVDLGLKEASTALVRETPVAADARARASVCYMCDGDINAKSKAIVEGQVEKRAFCSPHCYFIYSTSLVGADLKAEDGKARVTDFARGGLIPAVSALYLYGVDTNGRPTIKAFGKAADAEREQQISFGNVVTWDALRAKELAARCAFCDRAVYPEDACQVKLGQTHLYGCCTHCSLGVAARLKQDIEVEAKDGLTGETIRVATLNGCVAALEPKTAVAWFGQKKSSDGKWVSAGCFKQGFFVNQENLKKWLDARPSATGRQIAIAQALADKMKLSSEQIAKACKLGECK